MWGRCGNIHHAINKTKAYSYSPACFAVDDPLNQPLADYFGIVMGTSHQEPMARSSPNEWNLYGSGPWNYTSNAANVYKYFQEGAERAKPYETLFTVGMRGSGDLPLEESTNIALLEKIIADQRTILTNVFNGTGCYNYSPGLDSIQGARSKNIMNTVCASPTDITLLWTDDNWGNIMRFPLPNERTRSGGAGVYYHVDYVGDPRDYKWITSSQIPKMWEQLSIASERNCDKDLDSQLEYTLNLDSFVKGWAQRDLGVDANDARVVTEIVANLTRWNARKKPELLNYTTYSVTNYREAETVVEGWSTLEKTSTSIYNKLSHSAQSAYYQTVHHAVLASSNLGRMLVAAGQNQLKASQARLGANDLAEKVEELFEGDYTLEERYHALEDGKWNHLMDQTHLGYYYWQQPMTNTMPSITRVQKNKQALAGPMRVTIEGSAGAWPGDNEKNCALGYNCPPPTVVLDRYSSIKNAYIDVSAGGPLSFSWTATSNSTMISLSSSAGNISPKDNDHRVFVNVKDWSQVPGGTTTVGVTFAAKAPALPKGQPNGNVAALVNIVNREAPSDFHGFVQGNGVVSIEAAHATRNSSGERCRLVCYSLPWKDVVCNSDSPFAFGDGPVLEYDIYTFDVPPQSTLNGTIYVSPVLNSYARPLAFGVALDSQTITNVSFVPASNPGTLPTAWKGLDGWVANSIIPVPVSFSAVQPGAHTFKLYMLEPAVVVQKIVFGMLSILWVEASETDFAGDVGGLLKSYLGPPESVVV
ncbi:hypothetical protein DL96DRAFT_1714124 [Flagelloscypha sp. PMI_526]|nr:hypothetical protein DL96DRAFT_1714124 [Flagelloscypha sp. PMI_526]